MVVEMDVDLGWVLKSNLPLKEYLMKDGPEYYWNPDEINQMYRGKFGEVEIFEFEETLVVEGPDLDTIQKVVLEHYPDEKYEGAFQILQAGEPDVEHPYDY